MESLLILQLICFVVMTILALFLALSRLQIRWVNKRYEQSRWLICLAMLILAGHYLSQMFMGYRSSGNDIGALTNILAYTPAAFITAYAIFNIESSKTGRRKYLISSLIGYCLIVGCFFLSWLSCRSLRIGNMLYVMLALFSLSMLYNIVTIWRAVVYHHKCMETMTAVDMTPYVKYSNVSLLMLSATVILLPIVIMSTTLLFVLGPLMLLFIVFFVHTFISIGYFYQPTEELIDESSELDDVEAINECDTCKKVKTAQCDEPPILSQERLEQIEQILNNWCERGGYKDNSVNLLSLSNLLGISKVDLKLYFVQSVNSNFRVWLSNVRLQAVKQLMETHPEYSNEAISSACGFTSRSQLYNLFRDKEGVSPKEYKDLHSLQNKAETV